MPKIVAITSPTPGGRKLRGLPPPDRHFPAPSAPPHERRAMHGNGNQLSSPSIAAKPSRISGPTGSPPRSEPSRSAPAEPPTQLASIARKASLSPFESVQDQICVASAESHWAPPR